MVTIALHQFKGACAPKGLKNKKNGEVNQTCGKSPNIQGR